MNRGWSLLASLTVVVSLSSPAFGQYYAGCSATPYCCTGYASCYPVCSSSSYSSCYAPTCYTPTCYTSACYTPTYCCAPSYCYTPTYCAPTSCAPCYMPCYTPTVCCSTVCTPCCSPCGHVIGGSIVVIVTGPSGLTDIKATVGGKPAPQQTTSPIFVSADTVDNDKEAAVMVTAMKDGKPVSYSGKAMGNTTLCVDLTAMK